MNKLQCVAMIWALIGIFPFICGLEFVLEMPKWYKRALYVLLCGPAAWFLAVCALCGWGLTELIFSLKLGKWIGNIQAWFLK